MHRTAESDSSLPRQAVLLVGGRGTRMWPLTAEIPKGLLPVAGLAFVEYQIRQLASLGVTEVVLAVGRPQMDAWMAFIAAPPAGVALRLAVEDEPLDTAGPVRAVLDTLDDRFFVLNGDVVLESDLSALAGGSGLLGTLGLVTVDDTSAYGVVVVDRDGLVERFVEKPPRRSAPALTVNAGVYLLTRQALVGYPPGSLSFEHVVFPDLVARGGLGGVVLAGRWIDIGTPSLYLDTHEIVMGGGSSIHRPASAHFAPEEAEVGGSWTWVAPDALVAPGAIVEESVVLSGATVGTGAVIRRAIIGPRARVGEGTTITGDAIVGPDAVIGEGCELDHGARIAPGTTLAPGAIVFRPPR